MKSFTKLSLITILSLSSLWADGQKVVLNGDNNIVTQIVNKGLSKKTVNRFIKPYKDRIVTLERKLERTVSLEEKYEISDKLNKARKELAKKSKEIEELNKFIENSKLKVVKIATKIYEKKGLEATLAYFRSNAFKEFEKHTEKNMKELSGGYRLKAKLLVLDNKYEDAKEAYEQAVKFERNADTLFDYAYFLQEQNFYNDAVALYTEALKKMDSNKDTFLTITILNNLANLYNAKGKLDIATEYYQKALKLADESTSNDKDKYLLLSILNNLGVLHNKNSKFEDSEKLFTKALSLCYLLDENNSDKYNLELAITLDNLGSLYNTQRKYKSSKEFYLKALKIYKKLKSVDNEKYQIYIANELNNIGTLYKSMNKLNKSEQYYMDALKIYQDLANINPNGYALYLPIVWNNLALLHRQKSITLFEKSLKSYKELVKNDFSRYHKSIKQLENSLNEFNKSKELALKKKVINLEEKIDELKNGTRVVNILEPNVGNTNIVPNHVESYINVNGAIVNPSRVISSKVQIVPEFLGERTHENKGAIIMGNTGHHIGMY